MPPELFTGYYFCKTQEEQHFARAYPWREHPAVEQLSALAEELGVVIPVSIYEKDGPLYYNSLVMIDADGSPLGVYRKSHIPDGPGYQEKYYFRPPTHWAPKVGGSKFSIVILNMVSIPIKGNLPKRISKRFFID